MQKIIDDCLNNPLKILGLRVLPGANYYSAAKVVLLQLDLGEYDEVFTNQIPEFYEKLRNLLPSLYSHYCSEGKPGGFFIRVKDGTLLGHVTEHIAIELQTRAGLDVSFGKTRIAGKPGVYNVVFRYINKEAGLYAAKAAVCLVNSLLKGIQCEAVSHIKEIKRLSDNQENPILDAIIRECKDREIPFFYNNINDRLIIGTGKYQKSLFKRNTTRLKITLSTLYDLLKGKLVPIPEYQSFDSGKALMVYLEEEDDEHYFLIAENSKFLKNQQQAINMPGPVIAVRKKGKSLYSVLALEGKIISAFKNDCDSIEIVNIDNINLHNRFIIERAAAAVDMHFTEVLVLSENLNENLDQSHGSIISVTYPENLGKVFDVDNKIALNVVKTLFPKKTKTSIPIIGITGSLGKTTSALLIAYSLRIAGQNPGLTLSNGYYTGGFYLSNDDCTLQPYPQKLLHEKDIDVAVVEVSKKSLWENGLGYENADVALVLNIHDDREASDELTDVEDVAYLKSIVAEQVAETGCSVLNADYELVDEMADRIDNKIIYFSTNPENSILKEHINHGNIGVTITGDEITIEDCNKRHYLCGVQEIEVVAGDRENPLLEDVLGAVGVLYHMGIDAASIKKGITTFKPDSTSLPGIMDYFSIGSVKIAIAYVPNPKALEVIKSLHPIDKLISKCIFILPSNLSSELMYQLGRQIGEVFAHVLAVNPVELNMDTENDDLAAFKKGILESGIEADDFQTIDDAIEYIQKFAPLEAKNINYYVLSGDKSITEYIINHLTFSGQALPQK